MPLKASDVFFFFFRQTFACVTVKQKSVLGSVLECDDAFKKKEKFLDTAACMFYVQLFYFKYFGSYSMRNTQNSEFSPIRIFTVRLCEDKGSKPALRHTSLNCTLMSKSKIKLMTEYRSAEI